MHRRTEVRDKKSLATIWRGTFHLILAILGGRVRSPVPRLRGSHEFFVEAFDPRWLIYSQLFTRQVSLPGLYFPKLRGCDSKFDAVVMPFLLADTWGHFAAAANFKLQGKNLIALANRHLRKPRGESFARRTCGAVC